MITRRHLRIKVMQALYAQKIDPNDDINIRESWIIKSSKDFYLLYLTLLDLFRELKKCGHTLFEKNSKKHLQLKSDEINPKFFQNNALKKLCDDKILEDQCSKFKINYWKNHDEYVRLIWDEIVESDIYQKYLKNPKNSFESDQIFIVNLFTRIIVPFDRLAEFIEEVNISWVDDSPLVNTIVRNSLKQLSGPEAVITTLYKNIEDQKFSLQLYRKVMLNYEELISEISIRTPNWDTKRIAEVDFVILLMALAEMLYFPSIPTNVTINEYLEIAKEYATPKSSMFINGILDKLLKDLINNNRINKNIRGIS